jgi:hypothetical protein
MPSGCDRILTSSTCIMTFRAASAAAIKRAAVQDGLTFNETNTMRRLLLTIMVSAVTSSHATGQGQPDIVGAQRRRTELNLHAPAPGQQR